MPNSQFVKLLLLVCCLVGCCAATIFAAGPKITVHVTTQIDPSGFSDDASDNRIKTVNAIAKRLKLQRSIRLVTSSTEADVLITVTSVVPETVWRQGLAGPTVPLEPGAPIPEGSWLSLVARATLVTGTYTTTFAEAAGAFRMSAPNNLAGAIDEWFRKNTRRLTRQP